MTTMTAPAMPAALEALGQIADPIERVKAAADLVRKYEARAEAARSMRDMAACVAHLDDGVPPVTMYRDVLQCSRGLFVRMIQRAPAKREKIPDAVEVARESAEAVRRHEAVISRARDIRDETSLLLLNGGNDPVSGRKVSRIANADLSRVTGLTTARVAQVRTGTR